MPINSVDDLEALLKAKMSEFIPFVEFESNSFGGCFLKVGANFAYQQFIVQHEVEDYVLTYLISCGRTAFKFNHPEFSDFHGMMKYILKPLQENRVLSYEFEQGGFFGDAYKIKVNLPREVDVEWLD